MVSARVAAVIGLLGGILCNGVSGAAQPIGPGPLLRTVDLNVGQSQELELSDGSRANVKLLELDERRDALRSAIRQARVKVEVNGVVAKLVSANYRLPTTVGGVQIDCPVTKGYYRNRDTFEDSWGLDKDARLRLWPGGWPWTAPGTFVYPIRQRWFAGHTQMGNEPSFVDGGDAPNGRQIYYHSGLDIGGCEGLVDVIAATDGLIISAGGEVLPEYPDLPYYTQAPRDGLYVLDAQGWIYRYVHLKEIDPAIRPGRTVKMGQRIGALGKEGGSGGWSHLHFDIKSRQPSGKWGIQEGYAFIWQAYQREFQPEIVAVARPHHLTWAGEKVVLDGSRSWSAAGEITRFEWTFGDGTTATGTQVERTYERAGTYSEILKVVDARGRIGYDFAAVQVVDKRQPEKLPPTIHASYAPTAGIHPGDPVTFKVRTFRASVGNETWEFGDGTPLVTVHSDGNTNPSAVNGYAETVHRFAKPGRYIVCVVGTGNEVATAVAHLDVFVDEAAVSRAEPRDKSWDRWLERKILPDDEAESMLRTFVETQLRPLPLPRTREEWLGLRDGLRREILTVLGIDDLVPAKWDLALKTQGTIQREGYRIEKITFESYPGMAISAVLYIPQGIQGRVPGIVSISGHKHVSKAVDYVQQRNVNLALRGCVVLVYDYYGYGDRKTGDNPDRPTGANAHDIRTFSHTRRSATSLEVLDAIRALDVLSARPEVDPERIGFTGESGGGNSTYWIAALDLRVKLAVPVSSVTSFDYWIRTDANWDWHQRPAGIRSIADIGTLLALHAPNPLVVVTSKRRTDDEEFPFEEAEKSYRWARHVYGLFGAEEAAMHYESTTSHGYQEDKREQLYLAVERWLRPPHPRDGKELPVKIEKADDLRCSLPDNNLTIREVYKTWLKPLPRAAENADPQAPPHHPAPAAGMASRIARREGRKSWPGGRVDARGGVLDHRARAGHPLACHPHSQERSGRCNHTRSGTRSRCRSACPRVRQIGSRIRSSRNRRTVARQGKQESLAPDGWRAWPELVSNVDASVSNWAWFAGRPWPGQWALDLAQAARFARKNLSATSVSVEAENSYRWTALLAGAAAPDLLDSGSVNVPRASLLDDLRQREDASLTDVPGLLEWMDVPQLRTLWPAGRVSVKRN